MTAKKTPFAKYLVTQLENNAILVVGVERCPRRPRRPRLPCATTT